MDTALYTEIRTSLDRIVGDNLKKNVFSACSVGIITGENAPFKNAVFHYGNSGQIGEAEPVDSRTVYDLASLTKPLVTVLCILALLEKGRLKLSDHLSHYFDLPTDEHKQIQIIHLLEHTSGFPAHREYYKELINIGPTERETAVVERITAENLEFVPGSRELYSDLGYILLGKIVEQVSNEKLDSYWQRTIIRPLGLEKGLFFVNKQNTTSGMFPLTGLCQWSNKRLCGLVNDDNCRSLGGVAGHAGLFGTVEALIQFCEMLLKMYNGTYTHPAVSFELMREKLNTRRGRWVLGFDTPTGPVSSSGTYFSDKTIGHLGFTGTSFWLDCKKMRGIVLLTNRVLCSEELSLIRTFRPQLHDAIMEKLTDRNGEKSLC